MAESPSSSSSSSSSSSPSSPRSAALQAAFRRRWVAAGFAVDDLPDVWRAQVAVWASDGVTVADMDRFFAAWRSKPRELSPGSVWRYVQVCCFNLTHPQAGQRRRTRYEPFDAGLAGGGRWADEPSWMQRDPGPDGI